MGVVCHFMTHPPTLCASCMGLGECHQLSTEPCIRIRALPSRPIFVGHQRLDDHLPGGFSIVELTDRIAATATDSVVPFVMTVPAHRPTA